MKGEGMISTRSMYVVLGYPEQEMLEHADTVNVDVRGHALSLLRRALDNIIVIVCTKIGRGSATANDVTQKKASKDGVGSKGKGHTQKGRTRASAFIPPFSNHAIESLP